MEGVKDTQFFPQALGLLSPWVVKDVKMDLEGKRVEVEIGCEAKTLWSDGTGERLPIHGYEQREWRHLDTMQFETVLKARVPRVKYPDGKTSVVTVPWVERYSRFSKLFETWAIRVLKAASSQNEACALLGIDWHTAHRIMQRAVKRGMERRENESVEDAGMDEKSFRRGQSYVSILNDLGKGCELEVSEGRSRAAADELWQRLSDSQQESVRAVALDMAECYMGSARANLPHALLVHDRFYVSKYLNEMVDEVRKQEHAELMKKGDDRLKGTK